MWVYYQLDALDLSKIGIEIPTIFIKKNDLNMSPAKLKPNGQVEMVTFGATGDKNVFKMLSFSF